MPYVIPNRGLARIAAGVSGATDIRQGVITDAEVPSASVIRDLNTVADLLAVTDVDEAAATNYARQDLANVAVVESDANDEVTITADAATISDVGAGETWAATFFYIEGANDGARDLLAVDIPAATLLTNGGDVTLPQLDLTITDASV